MKILLLLCLAPVVLQAAITLTGCEMGGMKCTCDCPDLPCATPGPPTTTPPTTTSTTTLEPTTTSDCVDDPCIALDMSPFTECSEDLPAEIVDYMRMDCESKKDNPQALNDLFRNIEVICKTKGHIIQLVPFECPKTTTPRVTTEGPCSPCEALQSADFLNCTQCLAQEMIDIMYSDCEKYEGNSTKMSDFFKNLEVICLSKGYIVELDPVCDHSTTVVTTTVVTTTGPLCNPCRALNSAPFTDCAVDLPVEIMAYMRQDCSDRAEDRDKLQDLFANIEVICLLEGHDIKIIPADCTTPSPTTTTTNEPTTTPEPTPPPVRIDFSKCVCTCVGYDPPTPEICTTTPPPTTTTCSVGGSVCDGIKQGEYWQVCAKNYDSVILEQMMADCQYFMEKGTKQLDAFIQNLCDVCQSKSGQRVCPKPPPGDCTTTPATTTCTPVSVCDSITSGQYADECSKFYDPVMVSFMVEDCTYFEAHGGLDDFLINLIDVCEDKKGKVVPITVPPGACT